MNFDNKTVLVTGGGTGIGRAIASAFFEKGARVMISGRTEKTLDETLSLMKAKDQERCAALTADMRNYEEINTLVDETYGRFGPVNVLVNNAGIYPNKPVVEMALEEWDAVMETNLRGPFLLCKAVAKQMIEKGTPGRIINITSGAHRSARKGAAHYASSKAALTMFTKVLALELAEYGINVNTVSPGLIDVGPQMPVTQEYKDSLVKMIPRGRMGMPEEIARAVLFMASEDADYITGESLEVDGGAGAGRFFLPLSDPRTD